MGVGRAVGGGERAGGRAGGGGRRRLKMADAENEEGADEKTWETRSLGRYRRKGGTLFFSPSRWGYRRVVDIPFELEGEVAGASAVAEARHVQGGSATARHDGDAVVRRCRRVRTGTNNVERNMPLPVGLIFALGISVMYPGLTEQPF